MSSENETLAKLFREEGYTDFKLLDPQAIIVSDWVRMKCRYGCDEYGQTATCPPNAPSLPECRAFFRDYRIAAVFHFSNTFDDPEDRHAWTKELNLKLLELEKKVFISGYRKAFLLFLDSCGLCEHCVGVKEKCVHPYLSRPSPEGLGVDVFATVRPLGFPIEVLADYKATMNRYAFLMID
jgi:predicted metal-binding protein